MKSVVQKNKGRCFRCQKALPLEEHHIFYGNPGRRLSEKYGLKVHLCHECHNMPPSGIHFNSHEDLVLKKLGQEKFIEVFPDKDFMSIFGRNYI